MNCPKCKIVLVKLGHVECATGNCDKMGCPRCRGIWFEPTEYRADRMVPLTITMGRVARLALQGDGNDGNDGTNVAYREPAPGLNILAAENKLLQPAA